MEHWTNDQIKNFLLALSLLGKVIANTIKLYCILYYWYFCYFLSLSHFSFYVLTKQEMKKKHNIRQPTVASASNTNEYVSKEILSLIALTEFSRVIRYFIGQILHFTWCDLRPKVLEGSSPKSEGHLVKGDSKIIIQVIRWTYSTLLWQWCLGNGQTRREDLILFHE